MPEISTALIIKIIVIAVAIGGGIAVIYSVKKAVSNTIGRQLSRANDLLRTINDATEERQNNAMQFTYVDPNVVNNIKRDFPDYDENIARQHGFIYFQPIGEVKDKNGTFGYWIHPLK